MVASIVAPTGIVFEPLSGTLEADDGPSAPAARGAWLGKLINTVPWTTATFAVIPATGATVVLPLLPVCPKSPP